MSKPDTWMPLYIGDYLQDTTRLSTEQHGAYLLLIMDYWTNGPLPDDDTALAQVTRLQPAVWKKHRVAISRLFRVADGEWHHKRIDEELDKASQFIAKQKANGAKGGRPKKGPNHNPNESQKKPMGFDRDNPNHNPNESPSPSPSPDVHSVEPSSLRSQPESGASNDGAAAIPEVPSNEGQWLEWFNHRHGISIDPGSRHDRKKFWPLARGWVNAGVSLSQMRSAIDRSHEEAKEPIAFLPAYADRVLASMAAPKHHQPTGRQAAISNYAAQAAAARGETNERTVASERDITGESERVA
ncbi:MAG: DUF1376 domain-containing protein [Betaproteobacteria bacterium]|nr:DUF1376 domain-containing protein [Betaproteobacteria bacterium]